MEKRTSVLKQSILSLVAVFFLADAAVFSQNVLWNNSTSSRFWYTSSNWLPSTNSAGWTSTKTAYFSGAGTRTIGIDMASSSLSLQKIYVDNGFPFLATNITIGNSSAVAGTLTLNGGGGDSILVAQQGTTLNFVNSVVGGTSAMNIALVKDESSIISNGGIINIGCNINGSGKSLRITSTNFGGDVEMTGANSYSGITYLQGGTGSKVTKLILSRPGGGTLPAGNKVIIGQKSALCIKTNQTLSELIMVSTYAPTIIVEDGATLTITGRLVVRNPYSIILNGTGKIAYAAGATLEYTGAASSTLTTTSKEFPSVSGPTNLKLDSVFLLSLHESRSIAGNLFLNATMHLGSSNLTAANVAKGVVTTNGSGFLFLTNVGAEPKRFPVRSGIVGSSVNTVTISNGGGLTYGVKVAAGLNPALSTSSTAVDRTWHILPSSTPALPVSIGFEYALSDVNSGYVSTNPHAILQYTSAWNTVRSGLTLFPSYPATITTLTGGVVNRFAVQTPPAPPAAFSSDFEEENKEKEITAENPEFEISVNPSVTQANLRLQVSSAESSKLNVKINDAAGRTVLNQVYKVTAGNNVYNIATENLVSGLYHLTGTTSSGEIKSVRFVKQ